MSDAARSVFGCALRELLYDGAESVVYRGMRIVDGQPVIVKALRADYPTSTQVARYRSECVLLQRLFEHGARGIDAPLEFAAQGHRLAMIFADRGAVDLSALIETGGLQPAERFKIASEILAILSEIHRTGIIHKDIKPSNILVSGAGSAELAVRVIDFGVATSLEAEELRPINPNNVEGSLPYLSPEQTGRMNRCLDYRSDFYSLGVTFFELFSGQLPFASNDPVQLMHCHLAVPPPVLDHVKLGVPALLSAIIRKLMSKTAEERYQTTRGIAADLQRATSQFKQGESAADTSVGRDDRSDRFAIPERLYGRGPQTRQMNEVFSRAAAGSNELLFVFGWSGIGKSSLIQQVHLPIADAHGYFISGKFDQFKRNIPYASIIQAFSEFIGLVMTESETRLQGWHQRLSTVLSGQGGVITAVMPEFERVLGVQAPPPELAGEAGRIRLARVFVDLVGAIATAEHPLVLFLDDLQWADQPTLQLLEAISTSADLSHLFVIGCYRDNEVNTGHPLALTMGRVAARRDDCGQPNLERIRLGGLNFEDLVELLCDTLRAQPQEVAALANLLAAKTNGNPFFVCQFLKQLHATGLIVRDAEADRWRWHVDRIAAADSTDNVVDLMASNLRQLQTNSRKVVEIAAAVGGQFRLSTLASAAQRSMPEVADDLWQALEMGFVLPLDDNYRLVAIGSKKVNAFIELPSTIATEIPPPQLERHELDPRYKFLHDRVQQAAYSLIPESERKQMHLRVGQILLRSVGTHAEDQLFSILDQISHGLDLIEEPAERESMARLCLQAGQRAQAAAAYEPAAKYYRSGVQLLGDTVWQANYEIGWPTAAGQAMCTYLSGLFDQADKLFDDVLINSRTDLEKARICDHKATLLDNRGLYSECAKYAQLGMKYCGVQLSLSGSLPVMLLELSKVKFAARKLRPLDLLSLPEMTDPKYLTALAIMANFSGPAFFLHINLYVTLVLKMCGLALKHGNCPQSAYSWGLYGMIVGPVLGDLPTGLEYGELQLRLSARYDAVALKPKIFHCLGGLLMHWGRHPRDCLTFVRDGFQAGLEAGDPVHAGHCATQTLYLLEWQGEQLEVLHRDSVNAWDFAQRNGESGGTTEAQQVLAAMARTLIGRDTVPTDPTSLTGDGFDEGVWLTAARKFESKIPLHYYFCTKMWVLLLLGQPAKAFELGFESATHVDATVGLPFSPNHDFRWAMAASMAFGQLNPKDKRRARRVMAKAIKKLQPWAAANPAGRAAMRQLLLAEQASMAGDDRTAEKAYEAALATATTDGYGYLVALAAERFGRWYLQRGREKIAMLFLRDCRHGYASWGAKAKLDQLDAEMPDLAWSGEHTQIVGTARHSTKTTSNYANIDVLTVVKASQAISGEIEVNQLVQKLLHLAVEGAGARRAVLVLEREGVLCVEGERLPLSDQAAVLQGQPVSARADVAQSVIQYVMRTRESVVLADVSHDVALFRSDPYLQTKPTRALLVTAIVRNNRAQGVMYLENDLTPGAFSRGRTELLDILSGQIAISIENAMLYREQRRMTDAFARFVPREFLAFLGKKSIVDIGLGDAVQRDMSVLFSDIRSFTTLSESMSPTDNFKFLNAYLRRVGPVIRARNGFIDKYIGDAVMALFPHQPADAIAAAMDMQREVTNYNVQRKAEGYKPIEIGVGIHLGPLMLGTIGESERMDSTVIADAVNIAARLEGLTKNLGSVLVSGPALAVVGERHKPNHRFLGYETLRGRATAIDIWEIYGHFSADVVALLDATRADVEGAVRAQLAGEFEQAAAGFARALAVYPADKAAAYLQSQLPSSAQTANHLSPRFPLPAAQQGSTPPGVVRLGIEINDSQSPPDQQPVD